MKNYAPILCVALLGCTTWACSDDSAGTPWRIEQADVDAGDECLEPAIDPITPLSEACGQVGRKACYNGIEYTCREVGELRRGELQRTSDTCCQTEIFAFGVTDFSAEARSLVSAPDDIECSGVPDDSFEWEISTETTAQNFGNLPIRLRCSIGQCIGSLDDCTNDRGYWEGPMPNTTRNIVLEVGETRTISTQHVVSQLPCTPRSVEFSCFPEVGLSFRPTGRPDPYYHACQWGEREENHLTCSNAPNANLFDTAPWMLTPPTETL